MSLPKVLPMEPATPSAVEFNSMRDELCKNPNWIMELKRDGYRCMVFYELPNIRLVGKAGLELRLPQKYLDEVADFFRRCGVVSIILDCELVAYDERNCVSPHLIRTHGAKRWLFAFDLLFLNGRDFRGKPLTQRKFLLKKVVELMAPCGKFVRYVPHAESAENKERGINKVMSKNLEGLVFKQAASAYDASLTRSWLKFKNQNYPFFRDGFRKRS